MGLSQAKKVDIVVDFRIFFFIGCTDDELFVLSDR